MEWPEKEDWGNWSTVFENIKSRAIRRATDNCNSLFNIKGAYILKQLLQITYLSCSYCDSQIAKGSKIHWYISFVYKNLCSLFQEKTLTRKVDVVCRTLITSSFSYFILDLLPLFFLTDIYHINLFHPITFILACHTLSFLLQSLKALLIHEQISVGFPLLWTQASFSNDLTSVAGILISHETSFPSP